MLVVLVTLAVLLWLVKPWESNKTNNQNEQPQTLDTTSEINQFPSANTTENNLSNGEQPGSQVTSGQTEEPIITDNTVVLPDQPINAKDSDIKNFVRVFTEGFGTYSNKNNYKNIESLRDVMSPGLASQMQLIIDRGRTERVLTQEYSGVTTTVLSIGGVNYESGDAKVSVEVSTQRVYQKTGVSNRQTNEKLELELVQTGDKWLVDKAQWKAN